MELLQPSIHPSAFVASNATVLGDVRLGPETVIMFGAVMRAEFASISVGARTNIQDKSILHCDENQPCVIGANVTVGHAAVVHGARIGDDCLVGIGSIALNGSELGEGAWLAAGSLLPEGNHIPPWTIAMGTPAKPVRELTSEEIERQRNGIANYQELRVTYQALHL
jgi:carbonic anhydrase/acetyltransferase-like protein (isoleucine patch superfamily)